MIHEIVTDVLKAEGWDKYTDNPNDRGGPTKWGITLESWRDFKGDPSLEGIDVRKITEAEARLFYHREYVLEPGFDKLPSILMPLVIDCGVNHGTHRAAIWVQKAVGAKQDGRIGPKTLEKVASAPELATYLNICAYRFRFYGAIVSRDHTQAEFASGWNNRGAKFLVALADLLEEG